MNPVRASFFYERKIFVTGFSNEKNWCSVHIDEVWGHVQREVIKKNILKRKKGKEQRGCCSFHYCGWREELNGRIDKRLKKEKMKIGGWWEERKEIFYAIFLHHRAAEKKEKWIENRLRKRGNKRREEHHWERITRLLLIFQDHRVAIDFFHH